jgi:flagellar hook assembly protein FlgD
MTANLTIDNEKPVATIAEISPNPFSPDPNGIKDETAVSYTVSEPSAVTVRVMNAAGVVVRELQTAQRISSSSLRAASIPTLVWDGKDKDGGLVADGPYTFFVSALDDGGNTGEAIAEIVVDNNADYSSSVAPIRNVDISPAYAKEGSKATIDFSVPEELASDPAVYFGSFPASLEGNEKITDSRYDYRYFHVVGDDPEGQTSIFIQTIDLAGNISSYEASIIVDKTSPEVSNLSVSPNPASIPSVNGQVSIKFNVSEPLKETPKVYVTQNGAPPQMAIVSGSYEAKFDPIAGYDGTALVTIEATDLANNLSIYQSSDLTIDTTKPIISNISSSIGANPEFTKFASAGAEVAISFNVTEPLKFNPDVKVNGNPAVFLTLDPGPLPLYGYKYTVSSTDTNGNATLTISGLDFALNEGTAETSSSSESFVIDLQNPTVTIAAPESLTEYISNPGNFSTNANPDGTDRPRSTTFHYQLAEESKVTVKVHKVNDGQTTYTKNDFSSGNLTKTLVSDVWQSGSQTVLWDGKNQSGNWAVPGKYAFIVEGRDRAGNLTLKKWGGTVWIQNNVLTLKNPDQFDFAGAGVSTPEVNPDPHYISPNGNSVDPSQKRARLYFMIPLTLDPAVVQLPERIEAQTVAGAYTKKVGAYSVKVYSDTGLTNLVRDITSEADAWSGTLIYDDWDGKNDAGQFVADGTYWMAVDVRDFAGNTAVDNLLKRSVVVDNTLPMVANLSAAPYYFSPGTTPSLVKNTTLGYDAGDNSGRAKVTIDVYKGSVKVITLLSDTWKNNGTYSQGWDGSRTGGGYAGSANGIVDLPDGIYNFKVSAVDDAGNSFVASKEVAVDTVQASFSAINPSNSAVPNVWGTASSANITFTATDEISGVERVEGFINGISQGTVTSLWSAGMGDGSNTVALRIHDNAGNAVDTSYNYLVDTIPPSFNSGPEFHAQHTPINSWSTHNSPYIQCGVTDILSKPNRVEYYLDNVYQESTSNTGGQTTYYTGWHPTIADGTHTIRLRALDNVGLYIDSPIYTVKIDTTAPNAPSVSVAHTPVNSWSNHNSPYFTWSDPGDGNGSGVNYYRGYIDGADQGNVSSGWHPTLSEGTHTVYFRAVDGVGLSSNSSSLTFNIDTQAPYLSISGSAPTFNPYVDGSVTVSFNHYDNGPSGIASRTARIKYGSNVVRDLAINGSGDIRSIIWDGKNNSGDYENEGDYTLEITLTDNAGNSTVQTSTIYLRDDQRITNNQASSTIPYLVWNQGTNLALRWIEGIDSSLSLSATASVDRGWDWGGTQNTSTSAPFYIDMAQTVTVSSWAHGQNGEGYAIINDPSGTTVWSTGSQVSGIPVALNPGWYRAWISLHIDGGTGGGGSTVVNYIDNKYLQYNCSSSNSGQSWGGISGPSLVDSYSMGPTQDTYDKTYWHRVNTIGGNIYYQRYLYNAQAPNQWVKLTNSGTASNPSIREDSGHNAYVAWQDSRNNQNNEIYFQKIPSNFARITGTVQGAAIKVDTPLVVSQSTTLATPELTAPADKKENVQSIRPTLEWRHNKGAATQYNIDIAKNDTFSIAHQAFNKSANTGSPDKTDATLYYFNYAIHEFDPGLDRETYYWKVTALSTNEAATSEVWSFTIAPSLTLTDITNYPNPFNPNRERTKLRYRLSTDASEVKIRVYDITGSLVTELDGTTNGEASSVWDKYNDIEWDGRNGRGDVVMNGIYPFEITARLGDRSVSGRGKIAVLK